MAAAAAAAAAAAPPAAAHRPTQVHFHATPLAPSRTNHIPFSSPDTSITKLVDSVGSLAKIQEEDLHQQSRLHQNKLDDFQSIVHHGEKLLAH